MLGQWEERKSQSRRVTNNPALLRGGRCQPLTSSVYWTSSTAYLFLKCSLEWILKRKHKECQGQGLIWAPSCPPITSPTAPCPSLSQLAPNTLLDLSSIDTKSKYTGTGTLTHSCFPWQSPSSWLPFFCTPDRCRRCSLHLPFASIPQSSRAAANGPHPLWHKTSCPSPHIEWDLFKRKITN